MCLGHAGEQWDVAYTCIELHLIWKEEYEAGVKRALPDSVFCQIITSAAYKLMYELLKNRCCPTIIRGDY